MLWLWMNFNPEHGCFYGVGGWGGSEVIIQHHVDSLGFIFASMNSQD